MVSTLHELPIICANIIEAQNFQLGGARGKFYYPRILHYLKKKKIACIRMCMHAYMCIHSK